jgi:transcriptional regulator with XRE-family HTH domain
MNTKLKFQFIAENKTQRQVAKATGIEEQRISEFVQEVRHPTEVQKKLLAKELNCKVGDIF